MSHRLKITLPDPLVAQLEELAEDRGEPLARVAAQLVSNAIGRPAATTMPAGEDVVPFVDPMAEIDMGRRAPWIEPLFDAEDWRTLMWGSICALYGRYPRALGHLKEGWWEDNRHVETLCALVVWRDWIDTAADDPRHELAFHTQLGDYARQLRQEGGGVTRAWRPGAAPETWTP